MLEELIKKEKAVSVIGLGYVGLPLALELAKTFKVYGYDINPDRIASLEKHIDPSQEVLPEEFEGRDIVFTADPEMVRKAHFHVVTVPTPIDEHKIPDLSPLFSASRHVGKCLKRGDYVVYESTVYPGCTEEDCLPILEEMSGLKLGEDFKLGYSPERINPGDREHTVDRITKVVSGNDEEALEVISAVYGKVTSGGVYPTTSIRVAEAAKVIENTQRDLNISFVNELSIIFDKMGIDTREVLQAAGTKWNFLNFYPGLVGGHCIGVDPYYLLHKSKEMGYDPQVILSGRRINDGMPGYIAQRLTQMLIRQGKAPQESKVLIMGITFKENVTDIRNSKVADLVRELMKYSINVHLTDPHASPNEVAREYNLTLLENISDDYDAVVVAVAHDQYKNLDRKYFLSIMKEGSVLMDLKGLYQMSSDNGLMYWRL